jgi:pimeloyl-ACP methyl ester carboxylesterase
MRLASLIVGALALSATASAQSPESKSAGAYVHPQQRVEVASGRAVNLVCMGSGDRTVLFDAGGSDWSVIWALVQPEVARRARACAYDRAGLGYSDPAAGSRSPIAIVEDMHAMVVAAGLKRPLVLVGHSLGGFNVKLYAALYPEDVAGLVLLDPAEERDWERTRPRLEKKFGQPLAAKAELLDRSFRTDLLLRYTRCREAVSAGPLDPSSTLYRRCSDPVRPQLGPAIAAERQRIQVTVTYQKAQASEITDSIYGAADSDEVYARLFRPGMLGRKPVIVLTHGRFDADDPLDVLGQEQGIALHLETARLSSIGLQRTVPDSGHNLPVEKPEAVVSAVIEVLTRLGR